MSCPGPFNCKAANGPDGCECVGPMANAKLRLDPPESIAAWYRELASVWRVVAIDVERGELHLERLP